MADIFWTFCGHLGTFEDIWGHLGIFGDIWGYLETFGDIWGYLGTFGNIWGHLGTSGNIWVHWADICRHKEHESLISDKKLTEWRQKEKNKAHTKTAPVYAVKKAFRHFRRMSIGG